jgi:hypothetical protein
MFVLRNPPVSVMVVSDVGGKAVECTVQCILEIPHSCGFGRVVSYLCEFHAYSAVFLERHAE